MQTIIGNEEDLITMCYISLGPILWQHTQNVKAVCLLSWEHKDILPTYSRISTVNTYTRSSSKKISTLWWVYIYHNLNSHEALCSAFWFVINLYTHDSGAKWGWIPLESLWNGNYEEKEESKGHFYFCSSPTNTARAPGRWPHLSTGLSKIYIGNNIICIIIFQWPKTFIYKTV